MVSCDVKTVVGQLASDVRDPCHLSDSMLLLTDPFFSIMMQSSRRHASTLQYATHSHRKGQAFGLRVVVGYGTSYRCIYMFRFIAFHGI